MQEWPKVCRVCGAVYTEEQWATLANPRRQKHSWGEEHEYRECPCGNTLVVVTVPEPGVS